MNHPFVDGNKRTTFFVIDIVLRLNGFRLNVKAKLEYKFIVGSLEAIQLDFNVILNRIQKHVKAI